MREKFFLASFSMMLLASLSVAAARPLVLSASIAKILRFSKLIECKFLLMS
jgi:hypothetical protein